MVNIHGNEKTHSYQLLTNPDISNSIDLTQDSCYFENQDPYTPFLEQPFEEKIEIEKSIEILHETSQKSSTQSIDRLEAQLSQLINIYRNKKTLCY